MAGNNFVDKVYLALELTKLKYYPLTDNARCYGYGEIYTCFEYFLQKLNNIDNIAMIVDYEKKIESLEEELTKLKQENLNYQIGDYKKFGDKVKELSFVINSNGGNMEPDVKTQLLKLLDTIFD